MIRPLGAANLFRFSRVSTCFHPACISFHIVGIGFLRVDVFSDDTELPTAPRTRHVAVRKYFLKKSKQGKNGSPIQPGYELAVLSLRKQIYEFTNFSKF